MQNIKPLQDPPQFQYGDAVYPAAHPERAKISRRYDADELILADENH